MGPLEQKSEVREDKLIWFNQPSEFLDSRLKMCDNKKVCCFEEGKMYGNPKVVLHDKDTFFDVVWEYERDV